MKKTFVAGLVLLGISTAPVKAGEVGLLYDKQVGKSQAIAAGTAAATGIGAGSYDAVSPSGVGVRLGMTLLDLKFAELGAALTYHPNVERELVAGGQARGRFGNEYVAAGVQIDWKFLLNLHAGVDLRREKLTSTSAAGVKDSSTVTRPWVKAGVGMSFPTPVVQPFVRVEVAVPVTKEDQTVSKEDFRKSMAPSLQVSLYGGIRF